MRYKSIIIKLFLISGLIFAQGKKIFISADLEGVVGAVTGEQLGPGGFEYNRFREFMTDEVNAAIKAAKDAGATEILVADSHGNGQNLLSEILPKDIYKKIKRRIASRILSTNKEKWWTVSAFYSECDEIRENEDKMFSFKTVDEKLKFLDGINEYVMNLEQMYSDS